MARVCFGGLECGRRNGGRRGGAVLEGLCSVVRCAELFGSLSLLRWRTASLLAGFGRHPAFNRWTWTWQTWTRVL